MPNISKFTELWRNFKTPKEKPRSSSVSTTHKFLKQRFGRRFYKLQTLSIQLDEAQYTPGDTVSGVVETNYFRAERITGIVFKVIGKARVTWNEKLPVDRRTYHTQDSRTNLSEETYIDFTLDLLELGDDEFTTIPAGKQEFPFEFDLPFGIPSTYDEYGGCIQYICVAIVNKIDKPKQRSIQSFIVVNDILDLKWFPDIHNPVEVENHKTLNRLCFWKGGQVGFSFQLDKTGFLPDEYVRYYINIFNMSSRKINETEIKLNREVRLFANNMTKTHIVNVLTKTRAGILPGEKFEKQEDLFHIPHTPPINLIGCSIIKVRYFLKFVLVIPGGINLGGMIPIRIGSMPINKESGTETSEDFEFIYTDELENLEVLEPENLEVLEPNTNNVS